jgi:two-component system sensor histidine kinase YesM
MSALTVYSFALSWDRIYSETYRIFQVAENELGDQFKGYLEKVQNIASRAGYFYAVQDFLLSDDPITVIFTYRRAASYLLELAAYEPGISNIFLRSERGRSLSSNQGSIDELRTMAASFLFNRDLPPMKPFFTLFTPPEGKTLLFFIYPVFNTSVTSRSNSMYCIVQCDPDVISSGFSGMSEDRDGAALLLFNGTIVSASREISPTEQDIAAHVGEKRIYSADGGAKYLAMKVPLAEPSWEFIYIIPQRVMTARVFSQLSPGVPLLCGLIIVAMLFLIILMRSVYAGMTSMVRDIDALKYGKPLRHAEGPFLMEIEQISSSVNALVERLDDVLTSERQMQRELVEAVTARTQAEFQSYRSQINPHFLFNTLECMRTMANIHHDMVMEELISSMSLIFRYSLYTETEAPVVQELEHIRNFMKVINIRYNGQFNLMIQSEAGAGRRIIPSMTLQPLVENAVNHGFSKKQTGGKNIMVLAFPGAGESFVIRVVDNGGGLSDEEAQILNGEMNDEDRLAASPLGRRKNETLYNVCRRMKLQFGDGFRMGIKARRGFYTAVELYIPGGQP